jgi:DNA segregation ATPase FtsK/SpoIIIE, S-DNA-T family
MTKNTYKSKEKEKSGFKLPNINIGFMHDRRLHLSFGFLLLVSSLFLLTAFISYLFTGQVDQSLIGVIGNESINTTGQEAENWLGLMGAIASHYFMFKYFGIASYLIPPVLFLVGFKIVFKKEIISISKSFVFASFFVIWISTFLGYIMFSSDQVNSWGFLVGGAGYELAIFFDSLFGWGTILLLVLSLSIFVIFFFNVTSLIGLENVSFLNPDLGDDNEEEEDDDTEEEDEDEISDSEKIATALEVIKEEVAQEELQKAEDKTSLEEWEVKELRPKKSSSEIPELILEVDIKEQQKQLALVEEEVELEIEDNLSPEERVNQLENYDPTLDLGAYQYPTVDLLTEYPAKNVQVSKEELEQNKDKIVETLINFKIGITSIKATIGPTVTLYEIVPDPGVKISKIKNLEDDIALSLAALGIRIIAPIPGKGTIGIEVPNKNREMVDVRSILATDKFMKSDMDLPIVFGKTISNEVFVTDLAKMPHLLMAGATGQGKSVGLNILLTSLIYKKHPSQLKFVLVDPKKVELTLFNKIERHFLAKLPDSEEAIITDTKKVINTLNSLCIEMDNRYDLLKDAGCRNLKEYNVKFVRRKLNPNNGHRFMPYIVLVIDELADLMMTAGKEVEAPIARLAQLARAIGIHLVVATQRPSVNVITGVIKANFPARLSFRVTSKIDSRTILDAGGADQLVGMGDMLLSMGSEIIRLQCGFVDTPEVERLCEFVGSQRGYETAYMLPEFVGDESDSNVGEVDLADRDALFDDAARLIVMHQQGSTSLIQRKLKLGYNRAGRLIDQLEAAGIVGSFEGSKAREVLIKDEYSLEQLLSEL